jgi:hypothetical protein
MSLCVVVVDKLNFFHDYKIQQANRIIIILL